MGEETEGHLDCSRHGQTTSCDAETKRVSGTSRRLAACLTWHIAKTTASCATTRGKSSLRIRSAPNSPTCKNRRTLQSSLSHRDSQQAGNSPRMVPPKTRSPQNGPMLTEAQWCEKPWANMTAHRVSTDDAPELVGDVGSHLSRVRRTGTGLARRACGSRALFAQGLTKSSAVSWVAGSGGASRATRTHAANTCASGRAAHSGCSARPRISTRTGTACTGTPSPACSSTPATGAACTTAASDGLRERNLSGANSQHECQRRHYDY